MIGIWKHFFSRGWKVVAIAMVIALYNVVGGFQESWWLGLGFTFVFGFGLPGTMYVIDHSKKFRRS